MPADRELAAIGCGAGGLLLGATIANAVSFVTGRAAADGVSQAPWWFSAPFAALAVAAAIQVTGLALRVALLAFAVSRALSIASAARALAIGPLAMTSIDALFASGLLVAAWPRAGGLARVVAVLLFALAAAVRLWIMISHASVFG